MTERWTDKKTGFTGSVPASLGNLSMKRFLQEQGGVSVTKKTMREDDGSEAIMKGHGMYARVIHEPAETVTTRPFPITCALLVDLPGLLTFYRDGATTKIAYLEFDVEGIPILSETRTVASLGIVNFTDKVFCHSKRFMHNVKMLSGAIVNRELYLVAMSFKLTPLESYSGWSTFVANNPDFALVTNTEEIPIESTDDLIRDLDRINRSVNNGHVYESDGSLDNWTILGSGEAGDCEDFALTKASKLLKLGYPASAMRLAAGKTEAGLGHAWLVVQTIEGDYALDVNYPTLQCDESLPYTHRQRQAGTLFKSMNLLDSFRDAVYSGYDLDLKEAKTWYYIYDPLIKKFKRLFDIAQSMPFTRSLIPPGPGIAYAINAFNFSDNDNYIYVSMRDVSGKPHWVYPLRYKETEYGTLSYVSEATLGGTYLMHITPSGDQWFRTAESVRYFNIHTGLSGYVFEQSETYYCNPCPNYFACDYCGVSGGVRTHALDVHVSSPDDHYDAQVVTDRMAWISDVDERDKQNDYVNFDAVMNSIPTGFWWQHNARNAYGEMRQLSHREEANTSFRMSIKRQNELSGLFMKDVASAFASYDISDGDINPLVSPPTQSTSTTLITPYESPIDLEMTQVSELLWERKWGIPWFHIQNLTDLFQGLIVTTRMTWAIPFIEDTRRMWKNGTRIDAVLATAAGVDVENILGLVYAPSKEAV